MDRVPSAADAAKRDRGMGKFPSVTDAVVMDRGVSAFPSQADSTTKSVRFAPSSKSLFAEALGGSGLDDGASDIEDGQVRRANTFEQTDKLKRVLTVVQLVFLALATIPFVLVTIQYATQKPVFIINAVPIEELQAPRAEICSLAGVPDVPPVDGESQYLWTVGGNISVVDSLMKPVCFRTAEDASRGTSVNCDENLARYVRKVWKSSSSAVSAARCQEILGQAMRSNYNEYSAEFAACRSCIVIEAGSPASSDIERLSKVSLETNPGLTCWTVDPDEPAGGTFEDQVTATNQIYSFVRDRWSALIAAGVVDAPEGYFEFLDAFLGFGYEAIYGVLSLTTLCELYMFSGVFYDIATPPEFRYVLNSTTFALYREGPPPFMQLLNDSAEVSRNLELAVATQQSVSSGLFDQGLSVLGALGRGQTLQVLLDQEAGANETILALTTATREQKSYYDFSVEFLYEHPYATSVSADYAESFLEYFNNAIGYFSLFAGLTMFSFLCHITDGVLWIRKRLGRRRDDASADDVVLGTEDREWIEKSRFRAWIVRFLDRDRDGNVTVSEVTASVYLGLFFFCAVASVALMIVITVTYATQKPALTVELQQFAPDEFLTPNLLFCSRPGVLAFSVEPKIQNESRLRPKGELTCISSQGKNYCGDEAEQLVRRVWRKDAELIEADGIGFSDIPEQCLDSSGSFLETCQTCYVYERAEHRLPSSLEPENAFRVQFEWSSAMCCYRNCFGCCSPQAFDVLLDHWEELTSGGIIQSSVERPDFISFAVQWSNRYNQKTALCDILFGSGYFYPQESSQSTAGEYIWDDVREILLPARTDYKSLFPREDDVGNAIEVYAGVAKDLSDFKLQTIANMDNDIVVAVEEIIDSEIVDGTVETIGRSITSKTSRATGVAAKFLIELSGARSQPYTIAVMHGTSVTEVLSTTQTYRLLEYLNDMAGFVGNFTGLSVFGIFYYAVPAIFIWYYSKRGVQEVPGAHEAVKAASGVGDFTDKTRNSDLELLESDANGSGLEHDSATAVLPTEVRMPSETSTISKSISRGASAVARRTTEKFMGCIDIDRDGEVTGGDLALFILIAAFSALFIAMLVACALLIVEFINSPLYLSFEERSASNVFGQSETEALSKAEALPKLWACTLYNGSNQGASIRNGSGGVFQFYRAGRGDSAFGYGAVQEFFDENWEQQYIERHVDGGGECARGVFETKWKTQDESPCSYCYEIAPQEDARALTGFVGRENQLVIDFAVDHYFPFCFSGAFQLGVNTTFFRTRELGVMFERLEELQAAGKIRIDDGSSLEDFGQSSFGLNDLHACNLVYFSNVVYPTDQDVNFTVVRKNESHYELEGEDPMSNYVHRIEQKLAQQEPIEIANDVALYIEQPNYEGVLGRELIGSVSSDDHMSITFEASELNGVRRHSWAVRTSPFGQPDPENGLRYIRLKLSLKSDSTTVLTTQRSYSWLQFLTDLFGFPGFFVGLAFFNGVYVLVTVVFATRRSYEHRESTLRKFSSGVESTAEEITRRGSSWRNPEQKHRWSITAILFVFDTLSRIKG